MTAENDYDSQIAGEVYTSPLKNLALETHEIYLELLAVGFPPRVVSMIVSQIISDAVLYKPDIDNGMDDDEWDFDEEDEDPDEDSDPA